MKKSILVHLILSISLLAEVTLSPQEEKNWQIETALAKPISYVPVGEYIMSVVTPPKLLYAVSVPYAAQVVQLKKVNYEKVNKGETLALLTSTQWIQAQKEAIGDAVELMHHEHIAERKTKLCKEEIIAQKVCIDADAEVLADKVKQLASKTLLSAYGASDKVINHLYKELTIFQNLELHSPVKGTLVEVNIQPGKSVSSSDLLFLIKRDGSTWLESDLPLEVANALRASQEVIIEINGKKIQSKVLQVSPIINPRNQTRHLRFSVPSSVKLLSGLRERAKLSIKTKAFIISKNAIVQDGEHSIVFIKRGQSYIPQRVHIITENIKNSYVTFNKALENPIVISEVSVLQNILHKGK
ncbi:MAG: hypothetical protein COA44_00120 [Arcobacter sp.]|nr:MAG: hypothetical protein COA44_00120 [Arcobacter sp.]